MAGTLLGLLALALLVLCAAGPACDFDTPDWSGEVCSLWTLPRDRDGNIGFNATVPLHTKHGPTSDHSVGTKTGHFALFLNQDHQVNAQASLVSPWFGSCGYQCMLGFAVNMFGENVGLLRVNINTEDGYSHQVWSSFGHQETQWTTFNVTIGHIERPFQVLFHATRGIGDDGHIALDSLELRNCSPDDPMLRTCALNEFLCGTGICIPRDRLCDFHRDCLDGEDEKVPECALLPAVGRCDFEQDQCGWRYCPNWFPQGGGVSRTSFNWTRHVGSTPSDDTGPVVDHTLGTEHGHFLYTEANVPYDGHTNFFFVSTPLFPPPPPETWDPESPFFGTCKVRFFFHLYGAHILQLLVRLSCAGDCPQFNHEVLPEKIHQSQNWQRGHFVLPKITSPYQLDFVLSVLLKTKGDGAIDDFSLTPECFGLGVISQSARMKQYGPGVTRLATCTHFETITEVNNQSTRFLFTTCTNTGQDGPTQYQCDSAYKFKEVKVKVISSGRFKGVQVWTVPKTAKYSITALGASGGKGVSNQDASSGAYANAKFNLTKNDKIYILVGQEGQSACSRTNKKNSRTEPICTQGKFDFSVRGNTSQDHPSGNVSKVQLVGGGGGGGGGTFVFKYNELTDEIIPLIIAGGGGGKSLHQGHNPIQAEGGLSPTGRGYSAVTPPDGPGGGGAFQGEDSASQAGKSLLWGAIGGDTCAMAKRDYGWELSGGFGGGGGGCTAGGGGGGYSGGNVSLQDHLEHNGQGGSSYINPHAATPLFEPGANKGDGELEVAYVLPCDCDFMCIYSDYKEKKFKCYCPPNSVLADDGLQCIDPKAVVKARLPTGGLIAAVLAAIVFIFLMVACIVCLVQRHNKKRLKPVHVGLDMLSTADRQLHNLRSGATRGGMVTEYNPNYDFGGTKCTLQDLRDVPRDSLTLVRALGQGAFGEVYQGYLRNIPREAADLPVAIKTLPALSTDQAEMDFLMEALIMSKFSHPNIVRFIGVCFEKHPRFIVLELLEGGDLKTFLRESRPKPEQPSRVTMLDLVKLALDVAKGCQYLEENHFIHRDIAARNCLLTTKSPSRVAKIADFGMARDIYRADYYRKGGKAMLPVKWMPPEAFLDGIFTSKTDTWSFGILLWEVFSLGYMPYPGRGNQEVMQLVTAGGRLEPPQNCPTPVYHIMSMSWHGIPERRPSFSIIIERLHMCLQDREVIHSPLPMFHRPPSVERDATIMRPRDPDQMVLTVEPPKKYLEPDSPNSTDQLIGPQSPDYDSVLHSLQKQPNLSASAESIDKLLNEEENLKKNQVKRPFGYSRVYEYDPVSQDVPHHSVAVGKSRTSDSEVDGHKCAAVTGNVPVLVTATTHEEGTTPEECLSQNSMGNWSSTGVTTTDSGKSSLENLSQSDNTSLNLIPQAETVSGEKNCFGSPWESRDSSKKTVHPTNGSNVMYENMPFKGTNNNGSHRDSCSAAYPQATSMTAASIAPPLSLGVGDDGMMSDSPKDQGDSGVVVDLKSGTSSTKTSNKKDCTWL